MKCPTIKNLTILFVIAESTTFFELQQIQSQKVCILVKIAILHALICLYRCC